MNNLTLKEIREKIDSIDDKLCKLYLDRIVEVIEVAKVKKNNSLNVEVSSREQEIIDRLCKEFGEDNRRDITFIYSVIMNYSKLKQREYLGSKEFASNIKNESVLSKSEFFLKPTVACQGVSGSYSHIASGEMFVEPKIKFFKNFKDVITAVSSGECDFGVLPMENSTAGSVYEVYDLLNDSGLYINLAYNLNISHCLLGIEGSKKEDIKKVYSHAQALYQCKNYLENIKAESFTSLNTAIAAETVLKLNDKSAAAIASKKASDIYGLTVLDENIQDNIHNQTRFIAISRKNIYSDEDNRISLIVNLEHKKNSLFNFMSIISSYGLNIYKIESRPKKNSDYEYDFYFDIEGKLSDKNILNLLNDMRAYCLKITFLGGYREI